MSGLRNNNAGHALAAGVALVTAGVFSADALTAEPVDIELVLAVDVSLSMSPAELEIQRRGYAAALTHDSVLQAIADGVHGRIAITYVEWAGINTQFVVVPWTLVSSRQDAEMVAAALSRDPPRSARRTSISAALDFGSDLFAESGFEGMKRVIDISGDGHNNQGAPVTQVRDRLVGQGITINGLPLMTNGGFGSGYEVANLDRYYADCVIGGPGAFMIPVNDWTEFPEVVRRKLVLELAAVAPPADQMPAPFIRAQAMSASDCLAGEKMWRNRYWMMDAQ